MTQTLRRSCRIARRADKQGARPAMTPQVAIEKSATEKLNPISRLMKCQLNVLIGTLNVRTLQNSGNIPELIRAAEKTCHEIICLQEHRFYHDNLVTKEHTFGHWKMITSSAWKNRANASIGGVGMLLSPSAYNSLNSIEMITPRIMVATFNGNPATSIISCYSPTNVSDESEVENFYQELTSLTRNIPKHN